MHRTRALLGVCCTAGLIGAFFNSLAAWASGALRLTELAGVEMHPEFTLAWLYPRLVWGALWGAVYFLTVAHPRARRRWVRKGLSVSLLPTLLQLFYFFPSGGFGSMGMALGTAAPAFVLLFNAVWGFFTGLFTRLLWGRR